MLSWRVLILPYLNENSLYKEFRLDEPWDSEHNKAIIGRMPDVYKSPFGKLANEGKTNYLAVRGEKTLFPGVTSMRFQDITDGASNTIMTVEALDDRAVVWSKPDDFQYDAEHPLEGLCLHGEYHVTKGFVVGMADGSTRRLSDSIKPDALNALFTRNGGEKIDPNRLEYDEQYLKHPFAGRE